ncbi:MAG: hypothetical protein K2M46_02735 [Lachnospiraceae bacterium]|nr:hypothetical protein [Lachnospiraceae bacterium]
MNEDSVQLLQECYSGIEMAVASIDQVMDYNMETDLKALLEKTKTHHKELQKKILERLARAGKKEKEPGMIASAFSWLTAEMKLKMREDNHQIAKLMMDGCNMGIQSLSEYKNTYAGADSEAQQTAKALIESEEEFMKDLKQYL